MRHSLAFAFCMLAVGISGFANAEDPKATNPGFEEPSIAPEARVEKSPKGWVAAVGTYTHVLHRGEDDPEGKQYLELVADRDNERGKPTLGLALQHSTPVVYEAGKEYRVKVDARLGEQAPTGGRLTMRIETPVKAGRNVQAQKHADIRDGGIEKEWTTIATDWFAPNAGALTDEGDAQEKADGKPDRMRIQLQVTNFPKQGDGIHLDNVTVEVREAGGE